MASDPSARLTRAVEAGDFEAIPALALEYGKRVVSRLSRSTPPDERHAALTGALEVLNRQLCLAKVMRAHLSARLCSVDESRYQPQKNLRTWQIDV